MEIKAQAKIRNCSSPNNKSIAAEMAIVDAENVIFLYADKTISKQGKITINKCASTESLFRYYSKMEDFIKEGNQVMAKAAVMKINALATGATVQKLHPNIDLNKRYATYYNAMLEAIDKELKK